MKKLAKLMAFIMMISTVSGFGTLGANAEDTITTEVRTYDFNDKSISAHAWIGASCFDTNATGEAFDIVSADSGNSYNKIDAEHGVSHVITGGAGVGLIFDRSFDADGKAVYNPVTGKIRYSMDVYAVKGDDTARHILQFNHQKYEWDNLLVDFRASTGIYEVLNEKTGVHPRNEFIPGAWYRVDIDIDAEEDSAVADVYVNGKFISTREIPNGIHSVWLTAHGLGVNGSNKMYIDNVRVERETTTQYANKVDFNEKTVSAHAWIGDACFDKTSTGGALAGVSGESGNSYQKVDDAHGTSLAMTGGAGIQYIFNRTFDNAGAQVKNSVAGKFNYTFDVYAKKGDTTGVALLQFENETYKEETQLMKINYANDSFTVYNANGSNNSVSGAFAAGQWHTISLDIDANASGADVDIYLDGTFVASRKVASAVSSLYLSAKGQGVNGSNYVYVDNIEITSIGGSNALTATPAASQITEDAEMASVRYSGTLDRASVNDEPVISVSEYNKDTGVTRNVKAYGEIDYTATKVNVVFEEALDDNCEYTVTLPENLKGLFGEEVSTSSVKFTTKMSMDYFDDFESYSNAAVMSRFGNREFSGAEGYNGGQAVTSVYNQTQYNIPEAINIDNATKDYIVSFDMKIPNSSKYVQLYVSYNGGSAIQWKGSSIQVDWNTAGTFEADKWHHYDFVFDFDKSVNGSKKLYVYQDGVKLSRAYSVWGTLSWVKMYAETGYPYHIDNFHARYANEVEMYTNLDGALSASTKEAYVKFDDAVSTLTEDNIKIYDEDLNEVEYTIKSTDFYGATIEFADGALIKNTTYDVMIENVTALSGETVKDGRFKFSTDEKFEVTGAKIMNGTTEVDSVAKWDNSASYKVVLNLDSTKTATQTIYGVVSGYKQSGELVNVRIVPVEVSASGEYEANLPATDMTNAATIKVFAVDGYANLAPLMSAPTLLN